MCKQENWLKRKYHLFTFGILSFSFSACSEKELQSEDVEYRIDENGTQVLHQLGVEEPFGKNKRAYIVGYHHDRSDHFKIGFVDGLKDGNFTFWQENGLKLVSGSFKKRKAKWFIYCVRKDRRISLSESVPGGRTRWNISIILPEFSK